MPGGFDVHVAAVAAGQLFHLGNHIGLGGVERQVGAGFPRDFQAVGLQVQGDQQARVLQAGSGDHAQAQRAAAGDDHRVAQLDLAALDGVNGAGQRFNVDRLARRQRSGHLVIDRIRREEHVFGHRPERALAEAVDIVLAVAHPVLPAFAEAAFPAGHDLLRDGQVAQRQAIFLGSPCAQRHHFAHELVPGSDRRLAVAGRYSSPQKSGAPAKHFTSPAQIPAASTRTSTSPGPAWGS